MLIIKIMYIFAYEIQTQGLDNTKTKTIMKTINKEFNPNDQTTWVSNELQAEVEKIGKKSKETSAKIDLEERSINYSGIETFDADLVIDKLNTLATFHETLSLKFNQNSKDNLHNSAKFWAESADGHHQAGKEVREAMSYIIRTQKLCNKIRNNEL